MDHRSRNAMKLGVALLAASLAGAGCQGSRLEQFVSERRAGAVVPTFTASVEPEDGPSPILSPTPTPIPAATLTPGFASATPPARASSTPAPTALTPQQLSEVGPWLLGAGSVDIHALDADDLSLAGLQVPALVDPQIDLTYGVSGSDGKVALRSRLPGITNSRYALYVYDLPDTTPSMVNPLLSDELASSPDYEEHPAILAITIGWPQPALLWSPDGRYLAFIGAMDGPSADVYALDTVTSEILRLTDGPNQPVLMGWSPDSRWVVHMEAEFEVRPFGPFYEPSRVWAADVQGGPASWLYDTRPIAARGVPGHTEVIVGWHSDDEFVVLERDYFGGMGNLSSVSRLGQSRETLFSGEIATAAVDPLTGTVAFVPGDPCFYRPDACSESTGAGGLTEGGFYLVRPGDTGPIRLDFDDWQSASAHMKWVPEIGRFMSQGTRVLSFTPLGEVERVFEENYQFWASPDGEWLAFQRGPFSASLVIYAAEGDLVSEITGFDVGDLAWAEDSSGIYLLSWEPDGPGGVFYYELSTDELTELHPDPGFASRPFRLVYP